MDPQTHVLFKCSNTLALYHEGRHAGFTPWIPVLHKRTVGRDHKARTLAVAAIPGYQFVPWSQWVDYTVWIGMHGKPASLCSSPHSYHGLATVTAEELLILQEACLQLDNKFKGVAPLQVNDRIRILHGALEGFEGVVTEVRNTSVRVLVGTKYVGLPIVFATKV